MSFIYYLDVCEVKIGHGCTYAAFESSRISRFTYKQIVVLGGLVVSVLATGPKVRGFNPGRG
jgi:hypothetical protein